MRPLAVESLPEGYTKCEYLEGTGTQYMNAQIENVPYTKMDITFEICGNENADCKLFGGQYCAASIFRGNYRGSNPNYPVAVFEKVRFVGSDSFEQEGFYTHCISELRFLTGNRAGEKYKGRIWSGENSTLNIPTGLWYIGYADGKLYGGNPSMRIYKANIDNNTTKRNFVPALTISGKPCMFDRVSQTPFINQGSGEFLYKAYSYPFNPGDNWHSFRNKLTDIIGDTEYIAEVVTEDGVDKFVLHTDRIDDTQLEAVAALLERTLQKNIAIETVNRDFRIPLNYKQVEYLQSQYKTSINTGIYATRNTEVEVDTVITYASNWGILYSANGKYTLATYSSNEMTVLHYYNGSQYIKIPRPEEVALGNRFKAKVTKVGLYINETLRGTIPDTVPFFKCDSPMILSGYSVTDTNGAQAKYYSFSMSEDGEKLLEFVPCIDETGAPCMFDVVSKTAFYNYGAADFLYPTESTTYALHRVLPDWGQLTEHGLRRLYHAPADWDGELYDYAVTRGFKPIIEPEMPEEGYWSPQWTETEDEIVLEWVETDPPAEDEAITETE